MAIKIKTVKELHGNKRVKAISYGHAGTAKSYRALAGLKRAVLINYEDGIGDIPISDDLTIIDCYDAVDLRDALEYIESNISKFDTVVIDSITKYGDKLFAAVSEIFPEKQDGMNLWQMLDTVSRQRFEQLMSLPLNIIIISLEEQIVLDSGFRGSYPSYKAKKFKASLEAQVDIILHHDKNNDGDFITNWEGSSIAIGKNRYIKTLGKDSDKFKSFQEVIDCVQGIEKDK